MTANSWQLDLRTKAECRVGIFPMAFNSKHNLEFIQNNYASKFFHGLNPNEKFLYGQLHTKLKSTVYSSVRHLLFFSYLIY